MINLIFIFPNQFVGEEFEVVFVGRMCFLDPWPIVECFGRVQEPWPVSFSVYDLHSSMMMNYGNNLNELFIFTKISSLLKNKKKRIFQIPHLCAKSIIEPAIEPIWLPPIFFSAAFFCLINAIFSAIASSN
jgi:hypothetical protein